VSRPAREMADVIAQFGEQLRQSGQIGAWQKKTLTDLGQCRTALLGGHVDACTGCGQLRVSYNSCRNRNCPKCQSLEREAWILGREADLLPVVYYHVVFTMPSELNGLCLRNPRFMYDTLFDSAWATLQKFAADPKWLGAQTGATMVLHIPTFGTGQALGPEPEPAPPRARHRAGRWIGCARPLAKKPCRWRPVFVPGEGDVAGISGHFYEKTVRGTGIWRVGTAGIGAGVLRPAGISGLEKRPLR